MTIEKGQSYLRTWGVDHQGLLTVVSVVHSVDIRGGGTVEYHLVQRIRDYTAVEDSACTVEELTLWIGLAGILVPLHKVEMLRRVWESL